MNKKVISIVVVVVIIIIFINFGRSVYMPFFNKMRGKETVDSRIESFQEDVSKRIEENLKSAGYTSDYPKEIILVAFKEERILQVYAKGTDGIQLIKAYPFTAYSGKLGPKLKEGDKQIPEGVYSVEYLNPNSSYYLSIKVGYPNDFDKSKTEFTNVSDMGGDIFIHGKSATIGCIPIGDEAIEEVFLLTQKALNKGVKVIISPRDFRINSSYPKIESVDWERELYEIIHNELKMLPRKV